LLLLLPLRVGILNTSGGASLDNDFADAVDSFDGAANNQSSLVLLVATVDGVVVLAVALVVTLVGVLKKPQSDVDASVAVVELCVGDADGVVSTSASNRSFALLVRAARGLRAGAMSNISSEIEKSECGDFLAAVVGEAANGSGDEVDSLVLRLSIGD
jgi:hypothetical protein